MINTLTRIVCRCVLSYKLCLRSYSKKFVDTPSALYVGSEHKSDRFTVLEPYLDCSNTFEDREKLKCNLKWRNIDVDVEYLYQQSILCENLTTLIKNTKENISKHQIELSKLSKDMNPNLSQVVTHLKETIGEARGVLAKAKEEFVELEKSFIIPYLQLPNSLHKNTTQYNECLFTLFPEPEFKFQPKSHIQIGTSRDEIYLNDVSPTSYFLKEKLALLELAVSEFIMTRFQEHDFKSYSNVDTARAVLAEGCGIELRNNQNYLRMEDKDCLAFNQIQFLFGGSSLTSFVALFCKAVVNFAKDVPIRLVSTGRKYNVEDVNVDEGTTLFNAIQSTGVSAFVLYPLEIIEEALVNEIAMLLNQTYTEFGLHFKLVQYGASKLKAYESLAIGLCMYSPTSKMYIEVGRISLCHDFISKRLQIYKSYGKKRAAFLGMIYVEVMDVRKWIGCLIENTQSKNGEYVIPECLYPFMFGQI